MLKFSIGFVLALLSYCALLGCTWSVELHPQGPVIASRAITVTSSFPPPKSTFGSTTTSSSTGTPQSQSSADRQRTLSDFSTRDSRQGFIRKVYSIFTVQMVATILAVAYIMKTPATAQFLLTHLQESIFASGLGSLLTVCILSLTNLRYRAPYNFLLLGVYTLLQSLTVGIFSLLVDPKTIIIGALHTVTVLVAITAYSFSSEANDLSMVRYQASLLL